MSRMRDTGACSAPETNQVSLMQDINHQRSDDFACTRNIA